MILLWLRINGSENCRRPGAIALLVSFNPQKTKKYTKLDETKNKQGGGGMRQADPENTHMGDE